MFAILCIHAHSVGVAENIPSDCVRNQNNAVDLSFPFESIPRGLFETTSSICFTGESWSVNSNTVQIRLFSFIEC